MSSLRPTLALAVGLVLASPTVPAEADAPRRARRERARERDRGRIVAASTRTLPQDCAMEPFSADYGALRRGDRVRLARHREVDGDAYWTDAMNEYVGRVTTVRGPRGVDEKGCPLVSVAADDGEYDWRVRDLVLVGESENDALHHLELAPGFAGDPRTFEGHLATEVPLDSIREGCVGLSTRAPTMRLVLTEDFAAISLLAHASVDLVLLVHTPDDTWVCADDVDDLDPVITGVAGAGAYEVWVGGYDADANGATFRFGISEKLGVRAGELAAMRATALGERDVTPPAEADEDAP